ncbi:sigma-70 family RNA polymerase sigma factor [Rhodococcus hoagii]|nr:sigma-70 family RNA polymerase sigma factor [Prescottella equi]
MLRLQLSGYSAKEWDPVAEELARYGLAVIRSWLHRRLIFSKVKQRTGYGLTPPPEHWLDDDHTVRQLTDETVVRAIGYFKTDVLQKNKWDVDKGASIRTFFIGQCLFQFANVYKVWFNEERERRAAELLAEDADLDYLKGSIRGIESTVVAREETIEALHRVTSERARAAFLLHDQGYSYQEIASRLGLADAKSVENMLSYQRRQLRRGA